MSKHTITAECEVFFRIPGMPDDEREVAYPKVEIEFSFVAGCRSSFTDPGWSPELEVLRATLIDGDGLDPSPGQVLGWASDWLGDQGYEEACRLAESESGPDLDAAYDRWRDEGRGRAR